VTVNVNRALRAVILTALSLETTAILGYLKDIAERRVRGTLFTFGKFQSGSSIWDVTVAELGAGNSAPAAIGERALTAFKPHVALLVGVAGGVKDVAIGDVVVGEKIYGYEAGKDTEHEFQPRPSAPLASYPLIQTARALVRSREWVHSLGDGLDYKPRAFVGAIAAGERVVASTRSATAAFISLNYGDALAVEMEGRGFMEVLHVNPTVHGMVIRGISDLLSGKSIADATGAQPNAARAAAAFAFAVLAKHTDAISEAAADPAPIEAAPGLETGWTRIQITLPVNNASERKAAHAIQANLMSIFDVITTTSPARFATYHHNRNPHIPATFIVDETIILFLDLHSPEDDLDIALQITKLTILQEYANEGVPQSDILIAAQPFFRVV
jgi:nucleoside phosphorylase